MHLSTQFSIKQRMITAIPLSTIKKLMEVNKEARLKSGFVVNLRAITRIPSSAHPQLTSIDLVGFSSNQLYIAAFCIEFT